jgi:hypothetical protein
MSTILQMKSILKKIKIKKISKTIGLWKRHDMNVQHTANWEYIRASKQRFIKKIKTKTNFESLIPITS